MFDKGNDDGVEHPAFLGRGFPSRQLQERQIAEVHVPEDLVRQVEATHADLVRGAPGNIGADFFFAFFH